MELEMLNWPKFDLYNISLSKSQTAYSLILSNISMFGINQQQNSRRISYTKAFFGETSTND